jgi:outer membrane protein TolC
MRLTHMIFPAVLFLGLMAGCVHYQDKPLSAAKTADDLESRSLAAPELKVFLEANLGHEINEWPLSTWDFPRLTLVALYYHPSLDVARAQWNVARAGARTGAGRPNPVIGIVPGYNFNSAPGVTPWIPGLNYDIPIETAGKRGHRIKRAEALSESARLNIAVTAWQVRSHLRASLLDFAAAQRRTTLLQNQLEVQQLVTQLLDKRLQAGAVSAIEITPSRVALFKLTADLAEARRQAGDAHGRIAEALGLPLKAIEGLDLTFDLAAAEAGRDLTSSDARTQALQTRADVLASLAEYAASQSALQLEVARQWPDVHLGTGYQWDQGESKWSPGLTLELPVLNRNQGPIAEAQARREEAAARFLALQARVIAEIDRSLANLLVVQTQLAQSQSLTQTLRQQAQSIEAAFKAGGADQLDVNSARLESTLGELTTLDAQIKFQQALGLLEEAIQRPLDLPGGAGAFEHDTHAARVSP